jgi:hypothetical protein
MNRKKELLILLIATTIVIVIWIIASIFQTKPSEAISSDLQTALEPLTPTFDQQTLDKISRLNPVLTPITTPTPIPTPIAAPTPFLTPFPTGTPSSALQTIPTIPPSIATGSGSLVP